jgi:hypothetical protein
MAWFREGYNKALLCPPEFIAVPGTQTMRCRRIARAGMVKWSRTFAQGRPSNMLGGGEMKITELLLAELDCEEVGIRNTLERVPELSAQLGQHALVRPRTVPACVLSAKVQFDCIDQRY